MASLEKFRCTWAMAFPASARRADRAGFDALETHDCFSVTEYMAIDHSGLTAPGESWKAVEDGRITRDGSFPINPSGGLIGLGEKLLARFRGKPEVRKDMAQGAQL